MKKNVIVASALVLAAAGYVITAWGLGRAAHERFTAWSQKVDEKGAGLVKIVDRQSTGGVFFSREDLTFEINAAALDKLDGAKPNPEQVQSESNEEEPTLSGASLRVAQAQELPHTVRFTVRNEIAHGPFPGFTSLGIAKISSRLLLDEKTRLGVAKVFQNKDPILVTSIVGFGGAGAVDVTSPAIDIKDRDESVQWQGFNAHFGVGRAMQRITCEGQAPGLAVHKSDASDISIGSISFSCDLNRAFDDLYIGRSSFGIHGMKARLGPGKPPFSMQSVAYAGNATVNNDFVDLNIKLLMKALKAGEFTLDDVEYNLSVKHLHGPTYAALAKKMSDLSTSSAFGDPTASIAMIGAFAEYGPKLLEYSPQIIIERIGFVMPEGEAGLKGTIQLNDFSKADLAQPNLSAVLLKKLNANADLWIDEGLLQKQWEQSDVEQTANSNAGDRIRAVQAQVSSLEQQGFIKREGDRLTSHIEFKQGQLSANSHPIGPSATN